MAARLMVRLSVKRPLTPGPSPAEGRGENEDTVREVSARPEAHALTALEIFSSARRIAHAERSFLRFDAL